MIEDYSDRLAVIDMANSIVKFDEHGDGPARYTIYNYQKNTKGSGYDYQVQKVEISFGLSLPNVGAQF